MSALLEVRGLSVRFPARRGGGAARAVDELSLEVRRGEILGLVGESGCGKSTTARALVGLQRATSGSIRFEGVELTTLRGRAWMPVRRRLQMVFQDATGSLDPRQRIGAILAEPLAIHGVGTARERRVHALELLLAVGLDPEHAERYPHELSGGQRQRVGIARAIALEPRLVVCDEPVSGLDVSVQARVLNLLLDLKERLDLSLLLISHDLSVVRAVCTRVAVMYLGRVVETAPARELLDDPRHPYTRALLDAAPRPDPVAEARRPRAPLAGEPPSPWSPPGGCGFHPRCPLRAQVGEVCAREAPELEMRGGRLLACHAHQTGEGARWT